MAHKGKLGPVIDRRDFNLNVDRNDDGFAHRYLVTATRLPPGIGHTLVGVTFDCGPDFFLDPDTFLWQSDPQFVGIFVYDCIVEVGLVRNQGYIKRIVYREAVSGVVIRMEQLNDDPDRHAGIRGLSDWKVIFFDPFFFDPSPFLPTITVRYKTWQDGPPH